MGFTKKAIFAAVAILALLALDYVVGELPYYTIAGFRVTDYYVRILMLIGINITLAVGLNLINGIAGQFSLGHAGFMAVGGYTAALVTCSLFYAIYGDGAPGVLNGAGPGLAVGSAVLLGGLVAGGLGAGAVGLVVGVPSLRLKGDYLAIVTLGFGEIIRVLIQNIGLVGGNTGFRDLTFTGPAGNVDVPVYPLTNFFWIFLVALLAVVISRNIVASTFGRALMAVREDEIAAEAMGVNTTYYKVLAFVLGSAFAGVAGGLSAHLFANLLTPATFTFVRSIEVVIMIVLGGIGSITGAVFGATALTLLPEVLRQTGIDQAYPGLRMVIYALLLILLMIFRPQGLLGRREIGWDWLRRRSRKADPVALTDAADAAAGTDARPSEDTHQADTGGTGTK
jgi:branched-chain amino acid transport system permease protein